MKNIHKKIKEIFHIVIIEPLFEARKNYLKMFLKDKKKALLLLVVFIAIGLFLYSFCFFIYSKSSTNIAPNAVFQNDNSFQNNIKVKDKLANSGSTDDVNVITQILSDFVWPIFEDYIGNTPDPTGKSFCYTGFSRICTFSNGNNEIRFAKTDTSMISAQQYSSSLMLIIGPIFVLLCIIQGFNYISNENHEDVAKLIRRFILSILLLILTPYILSFSIILVNLLTNAVMANSSISSSLNSVVESIIRGVEQNEAAKALMDGNILVYFLKGGALSQMFTFLCIAIPFGLVLMLLIYICFQFIIRFLNLYFLTAVYPFVIIFSVYPKTQSIVNSFFKQWSTFLIQQPVFILGFKIVIDMLVQLSNKGGNSLQYLIIFIGILLFLASINLFATRIWGDTYSVISQNVTAAVGAGGLISSIRNPFGNITSGNSSKLGNGSNYNLFNVEKDGINTNPLVSLGSQATTGNQSADNSALKPKSPMQKDDRSNITKTLDGAGYDIQENKDGTATISGLFYANKNSNSELSTLYLSKADAINDGNIPKDIQQIGLSNLNILDSSNGKAINKYNNEINQIAASNGVKAQDINIGQNSLDKKVFRSMNLAKNNNLSKNIQGIGIKNDLITGDRSKSIDNKVKIIAYKEVINNKVNGTI